MGIEWKPGYEKEVEQICTELNEMVERNREWFKERDRWRSMEPKELEEIEVRWADGFYIDIKDTRGPVYWRHRRVAEHTSDGFIFECNIPGVKIISMFHDTIDNVVYVLLANDSLMPKFIGVRGTPVGSRPIEWVFL